MQTSYITNNSQDFNDSVKYVDLTTGSYQISDPGIYIITNIGTSSYQIQLNYSSYNPSIADGQTVIIVNQDLSGSALTDIPEYPTLDPGIVYKFVSDGVTWRKVPTPGAMYANGGLKSGDSSLTKPGVYVNVSDSNNIKLPNASEFDGQTVIIFNPYYDCEISSRIYTFDNSFTAVLNMYPATSLKVKSVGGCWRLIKYTD